MPNQLPTSFQQLIHLSRYARWDAKAGRREDWLGTVDRYFDFFIPYLNEHHDAHISVEAGDIMSAVGNLDVLPSMRCLMAAGPALARDHIAGYNCAYRVINDIRAFDEILFILMCSTGVGFSVERQYVNELPAVPEQLTESNIAITVRDSKRGWAEAYRELLGLLYAGRIPTLDTSKLRARGARLKTMGGTSSGPQPLVDLFKFTIHIFQGAVGRKLTSIECHDLVCMIGECVVVGGVRRSALLSLSNLSDQRMRDAKSGEWYELTPWRRIANNSVAYTETPEVGQFMEEWLALYQSKSGERGIFNKQAAHAQAIKSGRRKGYLGNGSALTNPPFSPEPIQFGTNPCSEIILRSKQMCNLSSAVVQPDDDMNRLADKIRVATILGTWQACLTNFRYITKAWTDNCEEERLLGVSMTNIMSNDLLNGHNPGSKANLPDALEHLKQVAIDTNKEWAERLNIPQSTAITCVKPEGNGTQLAGVHGSGIHPVWSEYHIRRVRELSDGPIARMLMEQGFDGEPDIHDSAQMVFSFPKHAPANSVFRKDMTAIQQLEHWKIFQDHWCEHKPSITVYAREREWPAIGGWVYDNFENMSGVSFLPYSDHVYKQAPYEEITKDVYAMLMDRQPQDVNLPEALTAIETEDTTMGGREFACTADACDL